MRLLRSSYLGTSKVLRATPDPVVGAFARAGGSAWFHLSRGQHRAALQNYSAVLDLPVSHPDVVRTAARAFQNYGRMLADFCRIASLTKAEVKCPLPFGLSSGNSLIHGQGWRRGHIPLLCIQLKWRDTFFLLLYSPATSLVH